MARTVTAVVMAVPEAVLVVVVVVAAVVVEVHLTPPVAVEMIGTVRIITVTIIMVVDRVVADTVVAVATEMRTATVAAIITEVGVMGRVTIVAIMVATPSKENKLFRA